jgi:PAS domain S-box-containing protein
MFGLDARQPGTPLDAARRETRLFDHNPDPALDELTELAAVLSNADCAYIGWFDLDRLWFKARFGFAASSVPARATACQWTLDAAQPVLLADASQDGRFPPEGITLPEVGPCLSYAGVPLIGSDQKVVGTLALLARKPERFRPEHLTLLEVLASQVVTRLELYKRVRTEEHLLRTLQKSERALARERSFVNATLDAVPALVAVLDTAGRIVRMNRACIELSGIDPTLSQGISFVGKILEPADRHWAADLLREAAGGKESAPHDSGWQRMRAAGMATQSVRWTVRPLTAPDGTIPFLIVSGQPLNPEQNLARPSSEARYREWVENSLGFVFTCTLEGELSALNHFTAETLGMPVEKLVGRSVGELIDEASATSFAEGLLTLEHEGAWQGAIALLRGDGSYRRIALRSKRIAEPGEPPFVLNYGIDVTEQYEAEEALRMATRQRELILDSAGDGIYGIDLSGRAIFINRAGAAALGYSAEELAGCDIHELVHHSQADGTPYTRQNSPIFRAMRRSTPIRVQNEIFWRKDGVTIPVEYSASPMLEDGQITGMVVAFQNVSERQRLAKMKDEFVSIISHEMKTPLGTMRGTLGLLQSGMLDKRPEKRQQLIETAIAHCDQLTRIVNDFLDFDKLQKGRILLRREPIEAGILLRRAADAAFPQATRAQIECKVEPSKAIVVADEERTLQVLHELVTNALKFSPAETAITLSAHPATAPAPGTIPFGPREIIFTVEDQGTGIAAEKLEKIFESFEQGDASDARTRGGTGMGLALCRSIVEQHGGRIWAESKPAHGSRFLFTLPEAVVTHGE